jgi:hypothetical protein
MSRLRWTILAGAALLAVSGCDEKKDRQADDLAAAPPPIQQTCPAGTTAVQPPPLDDSPALKDAVAAAPIGAAAADPGRVLFDGEKPTSPLASDAATVLAGTLGSRDKAAAVINAPAKPNTLKINEPPSPQSDGSALSTTGGVGDSGGRGLTSGSTGVLPHTQKQTGLGTTGGTVPTTFPAGTKPRILYLGDSLSTRYFGLGPAMYDSLVKAHPEAAVEMYAYGGSSPFWFLPKYRRVGMGNVFTPGVAQPTPTAPKIDELLKAGPAKMVVVEQGTNMINWTALKNGQPGGIGGLSDATALARSIADGHSSCLWIGPPDMDGYKGSNKAQVVKAIQDGDAALAKAVAPYCTYIKSSDKTQYAGADGIHQNAAKGHAWANTLLGDPQFRIP